VEAHRVALGSIGTYHHSANAQRWKVAVGGRHIERVDGIDHLAMSVTPTAFSAT
jgi:hypothetical protein